MATSIRDFYIGLYQEHLEEASFLYDQRLTLFDDPEISWKDIAEFEERLEAHLDALVVGEDLALEICRTQAKEGDFGELHAAVCVFCRQAQLNDVLECLAQIDPGDEEQANAIVDALKYELPAEWVQGFTNILSDQHDNLVPLLARALAYRRLPVSDALVPFLETIDGRGLPDLIWSLGRLRDQSAREPLGKLINHKDPAISQAAIYSLLRLGDTQGRDECIRRLATDPWSHLPVALAGGPAVADLLCGVLDTDGGTADTVLALGILGDSASVERCLALLADPDRADATATALHAITGAGLMEEVFIPEEIDEDELLDAELEKYKETGEAPKRPDGQPFGETITRLSQNPEQWQQWWQEKQANFKLGVRYRAGKSYSPAALLACLVDEASPNRLRQLACEELLIRYNIDLPFETDMLVTQQVAVLNALGQELEGLSKQFQVGDWYFAGDPISQ